MPLRKNKSPRKSVKKLPRAFLGYEDDQYILKFQFFPAIPAGLSGKFDERTLLPHCFEILFDEMNQLELIQLINNFALHKVRANKPCLEISA